MNFSANNPIIFIIVAAIIGVVVAQSVFFLVKAYKRGLELGMEKKVLTDTIRRSALFTIAPAVAIFMGLVSLINMLGVALPWLRLSVIGAVTYELPAAESAAASMGIDGITAASIGAKEFVTIAFVMTFGISVSLILAPILCKKITGGMLKVKDKDKKWMGILMTSMFVGMLSAFLGYIVCNLGFVDGDNGIEFHYQLEYWIPVFVMAISAGIMGICGILLKKLKWKWLNDYALPISMIGSMALAIPLTLIIA
ncbi:MAG: DUF5058 family protein [Clostridia bacterium]|nr:DUF5058 family protein [Clostridia bacterium]